MSDKTIQITTVVITGLVLALTVYSIFFSDKLFSEEATAEVEPA